MGNFDKIKYNNDFNAQKYDRFSLLVPKGQKEVIKEAADAVGKSTNAYIWDAVQKEMAANNSDENG